MDQSNIKRAVAAYSGVDHAEAALERAHRKLSQAIYVLTPEEFVEYVKQTTERDVKRNQREEASA